MTPIDWKRSEGSQDVGDGSCHHSLVTPIDWKRKGDEDPTGQLGKSGHHSLVTPIDWKPDGIAEGEAVDVGSPLAGDTY